MNFDCGNINTENMSYSQKFAAIIARMHKLKFGNMLTGVSEIEFKTMSAISRISLEEKEYIERQTDKQDRRNTFVKLTTKGEEQQKAWMKSFEEFSEAIFARLGDEKSNKLLEDLEAFVKASKEERKAREEAKK